MTTAIDATATVHERSPVSTARPSTAAFKDVPPERSLRDAIRAAADAYCRRLDKSKPLTKESTRAMAEEVLRQLGLSERYLGFTMVMITNAFWRDQVAAVPFHRRLMLLPHCLKNAEGCPADYDEFGLDCRKCGACHVGDFRTKAEQLGYKVLISEGTPIVLKIIVSGHVDAIVGVACLNVLEKAFDKVLLAGIPCLATPLLSSNCKNTSVDNDWVFETMGVHTPPPPQQTKTYMHLMRAANKLFEEAELYRLAAPPRGGKLSLSEALHHIDPLIRQEAIALDFLMRGGKRFRPFITLAAYDAMRGAPATRQAEGWEFSDAVKRTALAIETFHKASLVHDDIEDDDAYRYGQQTLHRVYGLGTAINVGDYLIGLGYRLVSRDRQALGSDTAADILDKLAEAHTKLSEGQGAELLWREAPQALSTLEALKIYALKTAPAFEAALYCGIRLAGPVNGLEKSVADFARHLGVAFQILNDIQDWVGDDHNKLLAGQDTFAARPTLLLALALEALPAAERSELLHLLRGSATQPATTPEQPAEWFQRVRELYFAADVFTKADKLVDKFRAKAEAIADELQPDELRELLYYLVDTVLEKGELPQAEPPQLLALTLRS
ncbi:MAG: polyprenyl synthetase [Gemmataceae bacterium]|uniref:Polyprenyl synthetase family protein n=1 Tax=Thermogemmata fonticola TaxID=2755323 RepID=A0A7V8VCC2_9BACT|nr:polyprenyl synthetase family protein [Thermogemmata fonticola]MBA2225419.1 polyprenyl synthetase family protein [Thermogemmata fonticola]GIW84723.1 MAG: polyprenyl synthetase [Gemmataceae bacterium]